VKQRERCFSAALTGVIFTRTGICRRAQGCPRRIGTEGPGVELRLRVVKASIQNPTFQLILFIFIAIKSTQHSCTRHSEAFDNIRNMSWVKKFSLTNDFLFLPSAGRPYAVSPAASTAYSGVMWLAPTIPGDSRVPAYWSPAASSPRLLLYLHGNATNIYEMRRALDEYGSAIGASVLAPECESQGMNGGLLARLSQSGTCCLQTPATGPPRKARLLKRASTALCARHSGLHLRSATRSTISS